MKTFVHILTASSCLTCFGCGGGELLVGYGQPDELPVIEEAMQRGDAGESAWPADGTTTVDEVGNGCLDDARGCAKADPPTADIAFDSNAEGPLRHIFAIHSDGSGLRRITATPLGEREPAFSGHGTLAFTSGAYEASQIHVMDLASGALRQVTSEPAGADHPSFSRDGALIAYHTGSAVKVVGLDGSAPRTLAMGPDPLNAYANPAFVPDGSGLVTDRGNQISFIPLNGSAERQIVTNWTILMRSPAISSDGQRVAYAVQCSATVSPNGGWQIWQTPFAVRTDPCEGRRLSAPTDDGAAHPAYGPGDRVAYERGAPIASIAWIGQDEQTPHAVTKGASDDRNPVWIPATESPPSR